MSLPARLARLIGPLSSWKFQRTTTQTLRYWKNHACLGRAWGLLSDFKYEQSAPDIFYGHLAADTVTLIREIYRGAQEVHSSQAAKAPQRAHNAQAEHDAQDSQESHNSQTSELVQRAKPSEHASQASQNTQPSPLADKRILDVGGGPGYFGVAFDKEGAEYFTCEPDVGEMAAAGIELASSVRGSGMDLPFASDVFDVTYSSNVAEHVDEPWRMLEEMLRVTAPGGIVIYSYTCWLGPFGGHETGLIPHYIGGEFAARRYERLHGREPKNRWGRSLFDISCADGLQAAGRYSSNDTAQCVAMFPRYHPWWAWWLVHVPVLREFLVSNLVLVFRKNA